jgi:hypothetical protein
MSLAPGAQKDRLKVMVAVNVVAALAAVGAFAAYWTRMGDWALAAFIGAIVVGLGAQIWFIAGLRVRNNSSISSERDLRANRRD